MRRRMFFTAGLVGLSLFSSGARAQPSPTGDPVQGARDFQETGCYACHGTVGHGGAWQGPKLAPDPIPYAAFVLQLRRPARSMPRYSAKVLSDAEVANIYAYLQTIPRTKSNP